MKTVMPIVHVRDVELCDTMLHVAFYYARKRHGPVLNQINLEKEPCLRCAMSACEKMVKYM